MASSIDLKHLGERHKSGDPNQFRYCCPFCEDTKFHLLVHLKKKVYICHRCKASGKLRNLTPQVNEKYIKSQDYELWARALIKNVKMKNLHEPLINFRTTPKFWKKRTSWNNIKCEAKVSFMLIRHIKAYWKLSEVLLKICFRLFLKFAPVELNRIAYKYFR